MKKPEHSSMKKLTENEKAFYSKKINKKQINKKTS